METLEKKIKVGDKVKVDTLPKHTFVVGYVFLAADKREYAMLQNGGTVELTRLIIVE